MAAHDAVWAAWWPTLIGLPESAVSSPVGGSFPSVFSTTRHLVDAERYWQEIIDRGPAFEAMASTAGTIAALRAMWDGVRARRLAWLAEADPHAAVAFAPAGGGTATVHAWECVIHVVSHAHFHRGQLVSQCRSLGVDPPSRHLIGSFLGEF